MLKHVKVPRQWHTLVAWLSETNPRTPNSDRRLGTHWYFVFLDVQLIQKATPWTKFHTESEQGTVSSIQCKIRKNRWESIRIDTSFFILFNIIQLNSIISMFNPTGQGPRAPKSKRRLLLFSFLIMPNLLLPRGHDHSCISCISYVIFKKINKI